MQSTVKHSDLAGHTDYGYCASPSHYFWGLKLYLVCTGDGMGDHVGIDAPKDRRT